MINKEINGKTPLKLILEKNDTSLVSKEIIANYFKAGGITPVMTPQEASLLISSFVLDISQIHNVTKPSLLTAAGQLEEFDFSLVTKAKINEAKLVVIPKNHWFIYHFENNPFKNTPNLLFARPRIWDVELKKLKEEGNSILYAVAKAKPFADHLSQNPLGNVAPDSLNQGPNPGLSNWFWWPGRSL